MDVVGMAAQVGGLGLRALILLTSSNKMPPMVGLVGTAARGAPVALGPPAEAGTARALCPPPPLPVVLMQSVAHWAALASADLRRATQMVLLELTESRLSTSTSRCLTTWILHQRFTLGQVGTAPPPGFRAAWWTQSSGASRSSP